MIRRPPRSTQSRSSAASDVYKRQPLDAVLSVPDYRPGHWLARGVDRAWLYARVWHYRADQLRPWRCFHDGGVFRGNPDHLDWRHQRERNAYDRGDHAADADGGDGVQRGPEQGY